jgi:exodeoxyribonuclease V gamma subunit
VGTDITAESALRYRPTKLKPKDRIRAWVTHLALNTLAPQTTLLIGQSEKEEENDTSCAVVRMKPVPGAVAELDTLVRGYLDGLERPLPVFEKASYEYARRIHGLASGNTRATADPYRAAVDKFRSSGFGPRGDDADPYIVLCARGRNPLEAEKSRFEALASELWGPLLAACEEVEP